jgi:hypothetical protein
MVDFYSSERANRITLARAPPFTSCEPGACCAGPFGGNYGPRLHGKNRVVCVEGDFQGADEKEHSNPTQNFSAHSSSYRRERVVVLAEPPYPPQKQTRSRQG